MAATSATFDPAAATGAYLATLPPAVHARAAAYTHGGEWILLWSALVAVAAGWLVLRSGVLVRLRERLSGTPVWAMALAVIGVDVALETVLALPWNAYTGWWRETAYGLTTRPFGGWLVEWVQSSLIGVVGTVLLLAAVYALIRRAPRTWWLWSTGLAAVFVAFIFVLAPVVIQPIFNTYTPAPPGPVRDAVVALAKANGVPSDKIVVFNGSKQSTRYTANVSGLGGTARIAMSDTMFAKGADLHEIRGVVGHEMGHYVLRHIFWSAGLYSLMALVAFFLVDRSFPLVLRLTGARGVTGLADPAGAPVVGIIVTVLTLVLTPVANTISRTLEAEADRFSFERANEPDGLSRALIKTVEYRAATPSRLEEAIFYSHPAVGARIRRAMEWKATHPTGAP